MDDFGRFSRWLEDRHAELAIRLRAAGEPSAELEVPTEEYAKLSGALELLEEFSRGDR